MRSISYVQGQSATYTYDTTSSNHDAAQHASVLLCTNYSSLIIHIYQTTMPPDSEPIG